MDSRATPSLLRSRLAEIDLHIARLRAERETVAKQLAEVVYPVLNLPNEISTQIFLNCVDAPGTDKTALRIASVCHLWRAIVLSTPELWSHFSLHLRPGLGAEYAQTWLARSGALPLKKVHLELDERSTPILELLEPHLPRVENLTLAFDPRICPLQLQGPFSTLETLALSMNSKRPLVVADTPAALPSVFADAPNLRTVSLNAPLDGFQEALPWTQLTKLELRFLDAQWCLQLLEHTPNLEILVYSSYFMVFPSLTTPHRLLPRLHTIDLRDDPTNKFLAYLTLPALDRMYLASVTDGCVEDIEALVERSRCAPTVLHMTLGRDLEFYALRECLWGLRSVRHLELEGPGGTSDAFNRLFSALSVDSVPEEDMMPQLVSLAITQCSTDIQIRPLVDMLEARRLRSGVKLESFSLSFSHQVQRNNFDDMVEREDAIQGYVNRLAGLRSQGVELELSSAFQWCSENLDANMVHEINRLSPVS